MAPAQLSSQILTEETERKPNKYAASVLIGVVIVMVIVCALNEFGVFAVNKVLMRSSLGVSIILFLAMQGIVRNEKLVALPASKYAIMSIVLLMILTVTVLLNIHAVLAYVLPLLLATQYRSRRISLMALIGSCVCCCVAPILSYLLRTWSLVFLTGYMETFCGVTVEILPVNHIGFAEAIWKIILYWALPQMLMLGAFGLILFAVTKSGIDSVNNQVRIVNLSSNLNDKLESIRKLQ